MDADVGADYPRLGSFRLRSVDQARTAVVGLVEVADMNPDLLEDGLKSGEDDDP